MTDALYTREVLRLAAGLRARRLPAPDKTVFKKSRICGSSVTVDITIEGGRVTAFGAEVKACALGQASTAIVERHILGASGPEVAAVRQALEGVLAGNDVLIPAAWEELSVFAAARQHKARHSAILLPFLALEAALA